MKYKTNKNADKKPVVILAVTAVICFLLSSSVIPFVFPKSLGMPDLLLVLCCVISAFTARLPACIFALTLGFMQDLFIGVPMHFSPVVYLVAVLVMPALLRHFKNPGTVTCAVCSLVCFVPKSAVGIFMAMTKYDDAAFFDVVVKIVLPEILVNFACSLVLFFVMRRIARLAGAGQFHI